MLINGQGLPQEPQDDKFSGRGPLTVRDRRVIASWDFTCVLDSNDEPEARLLTFSVESVDEQQVSEHTAFAVLFKQHTTKPAIIKEMTTPRLEGPASDPYLRDYCHPEGHEVNEHQEHHGHHNVFNDEPPRKFDIEEELADLHWMEHQLRELEWQITEKRQTIEDYFHVKSEAELTGCDSIRCAAKAAFNKVKGVAHKVYLTMKDEKNQPKSDVNGHGGHDWPSHKHESHKHRDHSHPPTHGNHSCQQHPSHPRKPHRFPICHFPPPFGHPHGPKPGLQHGPSGEFEDKPQGPPWGEHSPPSPQFDGPLHFGGPPTRHDGPPPGHGEHPPHPDYDYPHVNPHEVEHEAASNPSGSEHGPVGSGGISTSAPRHRHHFNNLRITKYFIIGFVASFLLIAIHRRCRNLSRIAAKQARREVRSRRRQQRRTECRLAWMTWVSKLCRFVPATSADYEAKAMLSDDSASDRVLSEIHQFKNATSVVDDMIAAEEGRSTSRSSIETALPDYVSDSGDGLPSYDDAENEVSSMISNGFRPDNYTTCSSDSDNNVRSVIDDAKE